MTNSTATKSLFDKIGGKAALSAVVDNFYERVLGDQLLAPLFAKTDMKKQRAHQVAFLAAALGGPNEYRGRSMRDAHRGLGITGEHFAHVAQHLQASLVWGKVGSAEITAIMGAAAALQPDVVG